MYIFYPFNVTIGYCPTILYDNDLIMWATNSGMTIGHLWDNHWDDYDKKKIPNHKPDLLGKCIKDMFLGMVYGTFFGLPFGNQT